MCGGKDAAYTVQSLSEIITIAVLRGTGMQRHTDLEFLHPIPRGAMQSTLRFQGADERCRRGIKSDVKAITCGLEDKATLRLERLPENTIMLRKGHAHGIGLQFPCPGTAFNIGKEKGDCPARPLR